MKFSIHQSEVGLIELQESLLVIERKLNLTSNSTVKMAKDAETFLFVGVKYELHGQRI